MKPDQTAPWEQSDLGSHCLQYRLPKNISRRVEQTTKVMTGRLRVKKLLIQNRLHAFIAPSNISSFLKHFLSYPV